MLINLSFISSGLYLIFAFQLNIFGKNNASNSVIKKQADNFVFAFNSKSPISKS